MTNVMLIVLGSLLMYLAVSDRLTYLSAAVSGSSSSGNTQTGNGGRVPNNGTTGADQLPTYS
jgi:hypothetical protein